MTTMSQLVWATLAILLCIVGAISQLAAHRSPDIPDTIGIGAARRVTCAALILMVIYLLDLMWHGCPISPVMSILFGLIGAGQIMYSHSEFLKYTPCDTHGPHARSVR